MQQFGISRIWNLAAFFLCFLSATFALGEDPQHPGLGATAELLRENLLDAEACFEVRDFAYRRQEMRLFFSDGYLIFRKPVLGRRLGALFVAREDLGDGEVIVMPPNRLERQSLIASTGAPTLNEHYRLAAFTFTDGTGEAWLEELEKNPLAKRRPERGQLLIEQWNQTVRNLGASLETRILEDVLNPNGREKGIFFASFSATQQGNFDLVFDGRSREEFLAGQMVHENGQSRYKIWTHFEPRRVKPRASPEADAKVLGYELDTFIENNFLVRSRVRMEVESRVEGLRVLSLDMTPLMRVEKVESAGSGGEPLEFFQREALRANLLRSGEVEQFLVRLAKPLAKGEKTSLTFTQQGQIFRLAGNGVLMPLSRAAWFPQAGWQAAPFTAKFTHPRKLTLVCPGEREELAEADGKVTKCRVDTPIRLFGFHLGDFEQKAVSKEGLRVELFANRRMETALDRAPAVMIPPPATAPGARRRPAMPAIIAPSMPPNPLDRLPAMTAEISDALRFFQGLFGAPPLDRLVAAPIPGNFGQGFPGLLFLSTLAYLEAGAMPAELRREWSERHFRDILQAHEVAHQWWGNLVTFETYRDEWLSEALTNYSALLYLEKQKGAKAVETVLEEYRKRMLREREEGGTREAAGPLVFGMRIRSSDPAAWHTIVYEKGTWVMHMLRGRLGPEAFEKLLAGLVRDFSSRPMTTEDLRAAAAALEPEGSPDPELQNFFETWVYGTGIPALALTHQVEGAGPKMEVVVTVVQTKVADDFEVDVPVEIVLPRGKRIVKWLRTGKEPETVRVRTGVAPLKVQFDPKMPILKQ